MATQTPIGCSRGRARSVCSGLWRRNFDRSWRPMLSELKDLFASWIAAVTAAIERVVILIVPQRRILLVEGEPENFTARVSSSGKGASLPQASFRLSNGRPEPAFN